MISLGERQPVQAIPLAESDQPLKQTRLQPGIYRNPPGQAVTNMRAFMVFAAHNGLPRRRSRNKGIPDCG